MLSWVKTVWQNLREPRADFHQILARQPQSNREFVVELVNHFRSRRVAEVGVWKAHLSRMLLSRCPTLEHLTLVDPLEMQRNLFVSNSQGGHPTMMQPGIYNCRMGEDTLTQEQLDTLYAETVAELNRNHPGRTNFIRLPSLKAAPLVANNSLDLVFIDAIHLYEDVLADVAAWLPKLKPNGVLAGDDYSSGFPGVIAAVNELFPPRIRRIHESTGVWYVRVCDVASSLLQKRRSA